MLVNTRASLEFRAGKCRSVPPLRSIGMGRGLGTYGSSTIPRRPTAARLASPRRSRPLSLADEESEPETWAGWFYEEACLLEDRKLALTLEQGEFLAGRIQTIEDSPRRCLLKDLLDVELPEDVPFWRLETVRGGRAALSGLASHAGYLSAAIDGATRAYGVLWARLRDDPDLDTYVQAFTTWAQSHPSDHWREWDLNSFWAEIIALPRGARARSRTGAFLTDLVAEFRKPGIERLRSSFSTHLIGRESRVKPGRARLSGRISRDDQKPTEDGALSFRWWKARRILEDIRERGAV